MSSFFSYDKLMKLIYSTKNIPFGDKQINISKFWMIKTNSFSSQISLIIFLSKVGAQKQKY